MKHGNNLKHKLRYGISLSLTLALVSQQALMPLAYAGNLPTNGTVVGGQASLNYSSDGVRLDVLQGTQKAVINWQSFNVAKGHATQFHVPNAGSTLNRVTGATASQIFGHLSSNGALYILNSNGIHFGPSSSVDVAGLLATTSTIGADDFMSGALNFLSGGNKTASVINEGVITVKDGGMAALISPIVKNSGTVNARHGRVELATAESFDVVDFFGDGLINFRMLDKDIGTRIDHTGTINADGGVVQMTAKDASNILESVINLKGIVRAETIEQGENGTIIIGASDGSSDLVEISGTLSASASKAAVNADGGNIKILGKKVGLTDNAVVSATGIGAGDGGQVNIGGSREGKGPLPNADAVFISANATVNADGGDNGDGGTIIAYATNVGNIYGDLGARGGAIAGDGGFIETSAGILDVRGAPDAGASNGAAGEWLIDPYDIFIKNLTSSDSGGTAFNGATTSYTSAGDSSVISVGDLNTALAANNVTITTASGGSEVGNVTFQDAFVYDGANASTLTVNAVSSISVLNKIESTGGALNLNLNAGYNNTSLGVVETNVSSGNSMTLDGVAGYAINTNGGNLVINSDSGNAGVGLYLRNHVATGGGDFTINRGDLLINGANFNDTIKIDTAGTTGLASSPGGSVTIGGNISMANNYTGVLAPVFISGMPSNSNSTLVHRDNISTRASVAGLTEYNSNGVTTSGGGYYGLADLLGNNNTGLGITWDEAYADASNFDGGITDETAVGATYLATVTSNIEKTVVNLAAASAGITEVKTSTNGRGMYALGATNGDVVINGGTVGGANEWYWRAGPEAGQKFYDETGSVSTGFTDWSAGDPNNGTGEEYMYGGIGQTRQWADFPIQSTTQYPLVQGYVYETNAVAQALNINAGNASGTGGSVTIKGDVGTAQMAFNDLSINAQTATVGNGTGATIFSDSALVSASVNLDGNVTFTKGSTGASGAITINGTVDTVDSASNSDLTVNTAGAITFNGAIGGTNAVGNITTDSAGTVNIGGSITATGNVAFNESSATITGDSAITAGNITFGGTLDSEANEYNALSLTATGGTVTIADNVGAGTNGAFGKFAASASTVKLGTDGTSGFSINTSNTGDTGNISLQSTIVAEEDVAINSTGGQVLIGSFQAGTNGTDADGVENLTIGAGVTALEITGDYNAGSLDTGNATVLFAGTDDASTTDLGGNGAIDVNTNGEDVTFSNAVTLDDDVNITGKTVTFKKSITALWGADLENLNITTSDKTVLGNGDTTQDTVSIAMNDGSINFAGNVLLNDNVTVTPNSGNASFGGDVTSETASNSFDEILTVNTSGETSFNDNVTVGSLILGWGGTNVFDADNDGASTISAANLLKIDGPGTLNNNVTFINNTGIGNNTSFASYLTSTFASADATNHAIRVETTSGALIGLGTLNGTTAVEVSPLVNAQDVNIQAGDATTNVNFIDNAVHANSVVIKDAQNQVFDPSSAAIGTHAFTVALSGTAPAPGNFITIGNATGQFTKVAVATTTPTTPTTTTPTTPTTIADAAPTTSAPAIEDLTTSNIQAITGNSDRNESTANNSLTNRANNQVASLITPRRVLDNISSIRRVIQANFDVANTPAATTATANNAGNQAATTGALAPALGPAPAADTALTPTGQPAADFAGGNGDVNLALEGGNGQLSVDSNRGGRQNIQARTAGFINNFLSSIGL